MAMTAAAAAALLGEVSDIGPMGSGSANYGLDFEEAAFSGTQIDLDELITHEGHCNFDNNNDSLVTMPIDTPLAMELGREISAKQAAIDISPSLTYRR